MEDTTEKNWIADIHGHKAHFRLWFDAPYKKWVANIASNSKQYEFLFDVKPSEAMVQRSFIQKIGNQS